VLPSVIALTDTPPGLAISDPRFQLNTQLSAIVGRPEAVLERHGTAYRVAKHGALNGAPTVLLPLDRLFDIRVNAALRFWRGLAGRNPGPDPAKLSRSRRDRLVLGLRALDGRFERATYREIAAVLFSASGVAGRAWKTHDLRDRTIRLVRYAHHLMEGGYRLLLLHPYRGRPS
jgi:hypothetical protein